MLNVIYILLQSYTDNLKSVTFSYECLVQNSEKQAVLGSTTIKGRKGLP